MNRSLDLIHPTALPSFYKFLAKCCESQIPVMIIETGRSQQRQDELWAIGRTDGQPTSKQITWTRDSKHVLSPERGMKALAIDICLYEVWTAAPGGDKLDWDTSHPDWDRIGAIAQLCGLKWGVVDSTGRRKDKGHFEFVGSLGI